MFISANLSSDRNMSGFDEKPPVNLKKAGWYFLIP